VQSVGNKIPNPDTHNAEDEDLVDDRPYTGIIP
jgi:hypothetical protein